MLHMCTLLVYHKRMYCLQVKGHQPQALLLPHSSPHHSLLPPLLPCPAYASDHEENSTTVPVCAWGMFIYIAHVQKEMVFCRFNLGEITAHNDPLSPLLPLCTPVHVLYFSPGFEPLQTHTELHCIERIELCPLAPVLSHALSFRITVKVRNNAVHHSLWLAL